MSEDTNLGRYRTGEKPMVGDSVKAHDVRIHGAIVDGSIAGIPTAGTVTQTAEGMVGLNGNLAVSFAARFDLISRAEPAPAEPAAEVEEDCNCDDCHYAKPDDEAEDLDALRDALWVCMEHNRLHHGANHNTVIQAEEALSGWTPKPAAADTFPHEFAKQLGEVYAAEADAPPAAVITKRRGWTPGDVIRMRSTNGGYRVWLVHGVFLGGEKQESVVELLTMDRAENTEGRMCVPEELLTAFFINSEIAEIALKK
jgi:hypothetical protein